MKRELKIYNFESHSSFKEGHQIILSIENMNLFRKYTTEIYNSCEKKSSETEIKMWEDLKQIHFHNTADFISNLWNHSFINPKLKKQLYSRLEKETYKTKINKISELEVIYDELLELIEELWDDQIVDYEYTKEFIFIDFLKLIKLQPKISTKNSIIENLYTYTDFIAEISLYEMFIFVNLSQIMTQKEFDQYNKYTLGKGIDCLFLESTVISTPYSETIVIDEDYYDYMI